MEQVVFTTKLFGEAIELEPGRLWVETRAFAPVAGGFETIPAPTAVCRRHLEFWADGTVVEAGEISLGVDDAITFHARGTIGSSPAPGVRHGTATFEVTGGRGRLAGARGYVTSNFLLADGGELTDHHVGVLFVDSARWSHERSR
jgi:hypothetical protein